MRKRRKCSGQELLHRLQGQEDQNVRETFQDQHQESTNNELDDQIEDHTLDSSSIPNENVSQQKEEPILIKVRGKNNKYSYVLSYFCENKIYANFYLCT
jgi:hypothetical protein